MPEAPMLITQVIGGLGNQMFQYAAARALSLARQWPLALDLAGFDGYALHQGFELNRVFAVPAALATQADLRRVMGWRAHPLARRLLSRPGFAAIRGRRFWVEPGFQHWDGIHHIDSPAYLMGYWQSEKYFQPFAAQIRADFAFKQPVSALNEMLVKKISVVNAVSLHVRRGDYVNNPVTQSVHGSLAVDYYQAAVKYISQRASNPYFFIFSDDIEWVRKNLKIEAPCEFVAHNQGAESYNDMRLMSLCRHHIIANSSFSWWGAWLNPRPDKIVVAPARWFANTSANASADVRDILPTQWVAL